MFKENYKLCELQRIFDSMFGKITWLDWEPETIMLEVGPENASGLLKEKILLLQALNHGLNHVIALPEFLLALTAVTNGEVYDFEHILLPTSLELAWTIEEIKALGFVIGQHFEPSEEVIDVVAFFLRREGYSVALPPFNFIPESKLSEGQHPTDTENKKIAISHYLKHMMQASEV